MVTSATPIKSVRQARPRARAARKAPPVRSAWSVLADSRTHPAPASGDADSVRSARTVRDNSHAETANLGYAAIAVNWTVIWRAGPADNRAAKATPARNSTASARAAHDALTANAGPYSRSL